jgi:hypothetical protein
LEWKHTTLRSAHVGTGTGTHSTEHQFRMEGLCKSWEKE